MQVLKFHSTRWTVADTLAPAFSVWRQIPDYFSVPKYERILNLNSSTNHQVGDTVIKLQ